MRSRDETAAASAGEIVSPSCAKRELTFSLIWIAGYLLLPEVVERLPEFSHGTRAALSVRVLLLLGLLFYLWKSGLAGRCGLCRGKAGGAAIWWLPGWALTAAQLWTGAGPPAFSAEVLREISELLCAAVTEELLFRGLLYHALRRRGTKHPEAASALIFGLCHLLNLGNGTAWGFVLLQSVYAGAAGYLFAVLTGASGSLLPGVFAHAGINVSAALAGEPTPAQWAAVSMGMTLFSLLYAAWVRRRGRRRYKYGDLF